MLPSSERTTDSAMSATYHALRVFAGAPIATNQPLTVSAKLSDYRLLNEINKPQCLGLGVWLIQKPKKRILAR